MLHIPLGTPTPYSFATAVLTPFCPFASPSRIELADPTKLGRAGLRPTLRLATFLGFAGGFLLAYQTSSRTSNHCARFSRLGLRR